jgi:hypothetical protein
VAVAGLAFAALWEMAESIRFSLGMMESTGMPFFSSNISEAELAALNSIAIAWLFREAIAGAILGTYRRLKAASAVTARELSEKRREPPILFLRSFKDDEQQVESSEALLSHAIGGRRHTVRLEEIVADIMFARGPLVALANPGVVSAPIGAARDVVANEDWQTRVIGYLEACQIVVCFFGGTPSFLWEIDQIVRRRKVDSMLFVFPADYPQNRTIVENAPKLAELLGLRDASEERRLLASTRVLVHDARTGQFEAIQSKRADSLAYREAIIQAGARILRNAELSSGRS